MKYCPSCGTQYTDDSLRFCLQDGSRLLVPSDGETPTVAFDETPTVTRQRMPAAVTRQDVGEVLITSPTGKRPSFYPYLIAGIAGALLFIAGAAATWYFLSGRSSAARNNNIAVQTNNAAAPTPGNTSRPSPTSSPRSSPASPTPSLTPVDVDIEQTRREVAEVVDRWRSNTEALDVDAYMENYADKVDYYNRRGASRATVRNDKKRAFGLYDSVRMEVSNMNISVNDIGDRATAEFDKAWDFRGNRNSSGKVRSQLQLRREGERWLISGERDLRVYYVN